MKELIAAITILFLFSCEENKGGKDLSAENLKSRVSCISTSEYHGAEKSGEIQKKGIISRTITRFDKRGNKTEECQFDSAGRREYKLIYLYDGNENLKEFSAYNPNDSIISRMICKYNDKGNRTEDCFYDSVKILKARTAFIYDEEGKKSEENKYDGDGHLYYKYTYSYDEKGNETEQRSFYPDGSLFYTYKYRYDDKGHRTEESKYKPDGSLEYKNIYVYEARGLKTEENSFNTQKTYSYDRMGNIKEQKVFNPHGGLEYLINSRYTEFDQKGNWLRKIRLNESVPESLRVLIVTEREIAYY